jgi:hypothetical protein
VPGVTKKSYDAPWVLQKHTDHDRPKLHHTQALLTTTEWNEPFVPLIVPTQPRPDPWMLPDRRGAWKLSPRSENVSEKGTALPLVSTGDNCCVSKRCGVLVCTVQLLNPGGPGEACTW